MRRSIAIIGLTMVALSTVAATKDSGTTTLKEVQPAGHNGQKTKTSAIRSVFCVLDDGHGLHVPNRRENIRKSN